MDGISESHTEGNFGSVPQGSSGDSRSLLRAALNLEQGSCSRENVSSKALPALPQKVGRVGGLFTKHEKGAGS